MKPFGSSIRRWLADTANSTNTTIQTGKIRTIPHKRKDPHSSVSSYVDLDSTFIMVSMIASKSAGFVSME